MKTVAWFCLIAIVLSTGTVSAQVLLRPHAVGSAQKHFFHNPSSYTRVDYRSGIGLLNRVHSFYSMGASSVDIIDGVIEFSIGFTTGGAPFPLPEMTEYNFAAMLTGMQVEFAYFEGSPCCIELWDLDDDTEDGGISANDWMNQGREIVELLDRVPVIGQILDPVDVTETLRRDLFGQGSAGTTSGFYLKTIGLYGTIDYNRTMPRLQISMLQPPTATPEPTVTPSPNPNVRVWMPSNHYRPSQTAACYVGFRHDAYSLSDCPLFVILDIHEQFFFAPDFNEFSFYTVNVSAVETGITVLGPFFWPEGCGSAEDIRWYAALTNPSMTTVISNIDMFTFGWSE